MDSNSEMMLKVQANSPYNDGWTQQFYREQLEKKQSKTMSKQVDFEKYEKYNVEVRKQWLPENNALFNNCGGALKSYKEVPMQRECYTPFYRAYIDWNLDVRLCCHDWKYKHTFGNLKDKTFKEVWYCKEFQELRKQLSDGNRALASSACSECNANGRMNVRTNTTDGKSTFENWKYDIL